MNRSHRRVSRSGFSALELVLAVGVLAIISINVASVVGSANRLTKNDTAVDVLDDQARTVMRRIALSVMSASRDSLEPQNPAAIDSSSLRYQVQLGIQDGKVVWEDPEQISMQEVAQSISWSRNPDTVEERRVVWTNAVAPYLEGELVNGIDDNGNGLIDEKGLSFQLDRNAVTIRLTLQRTNKDGVSFDSTLETTVTCRNPQASP